MEKNFCSVLSQKNFDGSENQLHQTQAFCDLPFPRYDNLDFPIEILIRLQTKNKISTSYRMFVTLNKCCCQIKVKDQNFKLAAFYENSSQLRET